MYVNHVSITHMLFRLYVFPYVCLLAPTYQLHNELAVPREM